ncbi:MAG TPA: uracil-DNA glycosylase [Thermoplasmata archaeon]|nr:uracil-DNA glycosylase [Thermoplasmata archaeon]
MTPSSKRSTRAFRTPTRRAILPSSRRAWERLSAEIHSCRKCPLGSLRTHAVVYRGSLSPRVVFIGEAPGAEEDRAGIPFVGRSGRELDRALGALGLSDTEFGVLNVLKCRPPQNRFDRSAASTCRPYLDRQLELLRPKVVVTLGAHALSAVDPSAPPVLEAAGRARTAGPIAHFPLIHPAAALRSRRWRERWETDLNALARFLADHAA